MIIGNLLCVLWGVFYILIPDFNIFIIAEVFDAIGFSLKGIAEGPFIYGSLKKINRISEYSKIEGKGSAHYYIFEAMASIVAGFLFTINVYLPVIFASSCFIISTIIAFYMIPVKIQGVENTTPKEHIKDTLDSFKFIFKSKRLHAMLLFACVFNGILSLGNLYIKTYFNDINTSAKIFGYVFAAASVASAIGARVQNRLEKKSKNKTLSSYSISYIITFLIIGASSLIFNDYFLLLTIGILIFMYQSFARGGYYVVIKEYVSRYTTSSIRTKIMSIYHLVAHLGTAITLFIASKTIDLTPIGMSYVIFGFSFFISIILILNYMSTRMGLDPSKYTKRDRFDLEN